jgi:hypothetical protein
MESHKMTNWTEGLKAIQAKQAAARARANRIDRMLADRATQTGYAAGLPRECWHNAMVGLHYGQPWAEVNYSLLRKAIWINEKRWELNRITDRLWSRLYDEFLAGQNLGGAK